MGMSMTPGDYLLGFVLGNWEDFQANEDSVRHAFNAVLAASHMVDCYYEYCCRRDPSWVTKYPNLGDYVKHVTKCTDGALADIRSIATAYKHLYPKRESCSIASTGAIEAIPIVGAGVREVRLDSASGTPSCCVVQYTTKNGQQRELLPVLRKVVEYWQEEVSKD